ncbi:MAG: relaxase/mobilization nuclease domain-containing protein [Actinomycetaceae bacterium]|nr:relaxase/mobilization nuclease domain-containing protein [Actinomycetaceae bacterium]
MKMKQVKATVAKAVDYVVREDATRGGLYVSSNFTVAPTGAEVARQFYLTAQTKGTGRGNVLAHHVMQNFKPGEVSLEVAHELGVKFAEKVTKGCHEYVIATHSDKGHFHNHIIFNPVSLDDGRKYRVVKSTMQKLRDMSDELCRERGLSVLPREAARQSQGRSMGEVRASEAGRSWKDTLRGHVSEALRTAANWPQFTKALEARLVEVAVRGKNLTFSTQDENGKTRKVRGVKLGEEYSKQAIEEQLGKNRKEVPGFMERIQDKFMGRRDNIGDGAGGTRAESQARKQEKSENQRKNQARLERDRRLAAAQAQSKEKDKKKSQEQNRDREQWRRR